jgi:hypothetical protein
MKTFTIKIPNDPFLIQCIRGKMTALGYQELVERGNHPYLKAYSSKKWILLKNRKIATSGSTLITLPEFFNMEEPAK